MSCAISRTMRRMPFFFPAAACAPWLAIGLGFIFFVIARGMVPKIQATVEAREKQIADDEAYDLVEQFIKKNSLVAQRDAAANAVDRSSAPSVQRCRVKASW